MSTSNKRGTVFNCASCGKFIYVPQWKYSSKKKKEFYCNKKCWLNRSFTILKCRTCNKLFRRVESNIKRNKTGKYYCSRKCRYGDLNFYNLKGTIVNCKICAKEFYSIPSRNKTYCSFKCRSQDTDYRSKISEAKKDRVLTYCSNCHKKIKIQKYRIKRSKNLFCSLKCRHVWSRGQISPKRNGSEVKCAYCGEKVYRAKWRIHKYNCFFCSVDCMSKQTTQFLVRPTKPEKMFLELVKEYSLPYKYVGDGKYWIGRLNPDFAHTNLKKVVEIFGDYWHNPLLNKKCKEKNTESGRKKSFQDKGYECIVVWEKDFNRCNWKDYILNKIGEKNAKICDT